MSKFKYSFTALLFILVVSLTSCQNIETIIPKVKIEESSAKKEEINTKIEQFTLLSFSTKKLAYYSLSSNEKFNFWKNHLNKFLTSQDLSLEQKAVIKESFDRINPNIYDDNTSRMDFKDFINGAWSKKVMAIFSKEQIQEIFMLIDEKARIEANYPTDNSKRADCDCNPSSLFIDDCGRGSCVYAPYPGCIIPDGDAGYSCGMFWSDLCNAGCR